MSLNARFFSHVTNRVVLCVVECEVGEPEVEEMIYRLTSWQVTALECQMKVTLLASGRVTLREGGVAVHHPAASPSQQQQQQVVVVTADDVWSVFTVEKRRRQGGGGGGAVHVYAGVNVGREGWCVLTRDYHTLVHVLQHHGMEAPHLLCACHPVNGDTRFGLLVPRAAPRFGPNFRLSKPEMIVTRENKRKLKLLSEHFKEDSRQINEMCESYMYYYVSSGDPEAGWVVVAGFDIRERKHRAVGRTGVNAPPVEVVCDEGDERGFVCGVSPLLRQCDDVSRNTFLRHFTQINPMSWDEACEGVCGDGGLRAAAFRQVCALPLSYLRQHAPHQLFKNVFLRKAILPWHPVCELKPSHD